MKNIQVLLITSIIVAISFVAQAQTNYELYSIENLKIYCPSTNNSSLFTIETIDNEQTLVKRNLTTGEVEKTYKVKLPTAQIAAMTVSASDKSIFIATNKESENGGIPLTDAIYSISLKKEKLEKLHTFTYKIKFTTQLISLDDYLLIKPYKSISYLLDLSSKKISPILEDKSYRMIFATAEHNGAIFAKLEDKEMMDMYFCDFSKKMKLTSIGKFQPDLVISSTEDKNKVPYFIIENDKYNWVSESYNANRYPSPVIMLADNKFIMNSYPKLNEYEYISIISLVADTYLIGYRTSKNSISVYNIKNPKTVKTPTVSDEDMVGIEALISSEISFEKQKIQSKALTEVFDANFYKIIFTEKETEDSNRTQEFIAYEKDNTYAELKEKEDLIFLINDNFVINKANAVIFQDALDALYPLDYFDNKAKTNYQKDNSWFFVRSDSFGEKKGFIIFINANGKVIGLKADAEIK